MSASSSTDDSLSDASAVYAFDTNQNPWQTAFIEDTDHREIIGSGAFGSGKTRAVTEKGILLSTAYPGNRGGFFRNTYTSLVNTTMETLFNEVLPASWVVNHNHSRHLIEIQSPLYPAAYCGTCGFETDEYIGNATVRCPDCTSTALTPVPTSEIYYDGLNTTGDKDIPEKVKSLELGWAGVDEATEITESAWSGLAARLRLEDLGNPYVPKLPVRQIFSATNPDNPGHWLHKRFYDKGVGRVYESSTHDNLQNLPDDYLDTLYQQYGRETAEARRYIQGEWVGYTGLVYSEFRESIHLINPLEVEEMLGDGWNVRNMDELRANQRERADSNPVGDPSRPGRYTPARIYPADDVPIYLAVDWGYRPDPCVVQWWALHPSFGFVLYRELYQTRELPSDMAHLAMDYMSDTEYGNVKRVYADHDSGDRADWMDGVREWIDETDATSRNPQRLRTTSAVKDVDAGIKRVKKVMRPDENDRAELYLIRGALAHQPDSNLTRDELATNTLMELRRYGYESSDSDRPQSTENHGMDAMRYCVYSHYKKGSAGTGAAVVRS